ncbi:unnamed protein product, partial [Heterosigma akashiwo]
GAGGGAGDHPEHLRQAAAEGHARGRGHPGAGPQPAQHPAGAVPDRGAAGHVAAGLPRQDQGPAGAAALGDHGAHAGAGASSGGRLGGSA